MVQLGQFRSLVQGLVQTAFQITGDLNESIVYNSVSGAVYDTVTGTTTETETTFAVLGLFSKFQAHEVDSKVVVSTDAKLSVPFLDLPITPNVADNLIVIGRTWKPVRILSVPGSALWTIHIRAV